MLGRTAHSIFWLYRYLERAENTARLLAAGQRMALTRSQDDAHEEWKSVVTTLGLQDAYQQHHETYSSTQVCDFVLRAKTNPLSVLSMFELARFNARSCRSSISAEVWESINEGWMVLRDLLARPVRQSTLYALLAEIRRQSTLARGATHGSMLRNEAYAFARTGTYLERADNTARILDVKYYLLLPSLSFVGTPLDAGQWDNVLRSLSAERAYSWLNAGRMDARSIAQILILDPRFPRSLMFCHDELCENLVQLAELHGCEGSAQALIRETSLHLKGKSVDDIFAQGLHQFLIAFITSNNALANAIAQDYRFIS